MGLINNLLHVIGPSIYSKIFADRVLWESHRYQVRRRRGRADHWRLDRSERGTFDGGRVRQGGGGRMVHGLVIRTWFANETLDKADLGTRVNVSSSPESTIG